MRTFFTSGSNDSTPIDLAPMGRLKVAVRGQPGVTGDIEMLMNVQKMTCNHCIRSVTEAVHTIDPQAKVDVDLASGTVRIDGNPDEAATARAIREAGFTVEVLRR